jgi:hypothetical protein
MQVLSQLSYNPTIGPLIGAALGRHPGRFGGCSAGEFGVPAIAGLHLPGSLRIEADAYCSRVNAFGPEYISRARTLCLEVPWVERGQTKVTPSTDGRVIRTR